VWGWKGTVDELLTFWFTAESGVDTRLIAHIGTLRKKGIRCYIATNNEKWRAQFIWETLGLHSFFDGIFSSADMGHSKNQMEFWEKVHGHVSEGAKEDILLWDDEVKNVETAQSFGFLGEQYTTFPAYAEIMKKYT